MDPNTNTREEFTKHLVDAPVPDNADAQWRELVNKLKPLLDKLAHHTAMEQNLQQTYMTPAASKNKVYFMWDFVGRTLGLLYQIDPTLRSKSDKPQWVDCVGRSTYAKMLMLDTKPGTLDQMTEMTYPGQAGQHPEFGEEVLALAREL